MSKEPKPPAAPAFVPITDPPTVAPFAAPEPAAIVDNDTPPDPPAGWTWDNSSGRYKKSPTE